MRVPILSVEFCWIVPAATPGSARYAGILSTHRHDRSANRLERIHGAHPIAHVQDHGPGWARACQQSCELVNLDEHRGVRRGLVTVSEVHTSSLGSAARST
jgi:hypothetical protein